MDGMALLVGIGAGLGLGGFGGWLLASFAARARAAASEASLRAAEKSLQGLEDTASDERARADAAERELAAARSRLEEREKGLAEQQRLLEQAQTALKDAFKATGTDVLNDAQNRFLERAKAEFESQQQLTRKDLDARQQAFHATLVPLREQMAKGEQLLKELGEKREGDSKTLGEQLRQIAALQQQASSAAQTLSSALRDNRQRGRWGEVSLRNIAEMAGLVDNIDFNEQTGVEGEDGGRLRPDMVVRLPGERFVPIDAKVPMNAYLDSLDPALSDAERIARRSAHAQALRTHVRALASREYAKALGSGVEITVLFVPLESGLIAALEEDAAIYDEALQRGIVITTSATLLALLRTCALQWQQAKLNENARRIGEHARDLLERIRVLADYMQRVGKGLDSATKAYNEAVGSYNSRLLPKARDTAELAGEIANAPAEIEAQVRPVREDLNNLDRAQLPAADEASGG